MKTNPVICCFLYIQHEQYLISILYTGRYCDRGFSFETNHEVCLNNPRVTQITLQIKNQWPIKFMKQNIQNKSYRWHCEKQGILYPFSFEIFIVPMNFSGCHVSLHPKSVPCAPCPGSDRKSQRQEVDLIDVHFLHKTELHFELNWVQILIVITWKIHKEIELTEM